jgi:hypothetical protein
MPTSYSAAFPQSPESGAEGLVRFSFPVTWAFLSHDPIVPKFELWSERKPASSDGGPSMASTAVASASADRPLVVQTKTEWPGGNGPNFENAGVDRWEMVIPKMSRPGPRSSKKLISEAPLARPVNEKSPREKFVTKEFAAPAFASFDERPSRGIRKFTLIGVAAGAVLLAGVLAFSPTHGSANSAMPAALRIAPALPTGHVIEETPRQISLVHGSMDLNDYGARFQIPAGAKMIGWVFRAQDTRNYYATRLEIGKSSAGSLAGVIKRFMVIDGRDQPVIQIPVTLASRPGVKIKVRIEVLGNKFTTRIENQKVDEWRDTRLNGGGFGFFGDRDEPSAVVSDLVVFPMKR